MVTLLLLAGCPGPAKDVQETGEDTAETGVDTADSGDTGSPPEGDVEGPDLPACTPSEGSGSTVALSGVILTQDGPVAGYLVYDRATGLVTCAGDCDPGGATVVCTEGIVSPGLIDAHNHLQYNSLPPWEVGPEFDDRYDWRSDDRYYEYRTGYDAISDDYACEIDKWAEARELIHGTTSVVGSHGDDCVGVLLRNLDEGEAEHGIDGYSLEYSASTVTDSLSSADCADFATDLASGALDADLQHVAEGMGGSVRDEIDHMIESGCVGAGHGFVHATDATTEQLAVMAATGTAIVWSPRSNLALYGTTTPIEIADRLGVEWAIAPDWTPSGSMAPTRELQCAAEWLSAKGDPVSDVRLWEKATTDAARIVGLEGVLGALVPGFRADVAVYAWSRTPYRAIIAAEPVATRLVIIDGQALYGVTDLVTPLHDNPGWCEPLDVCGEQRSICVAADSSGDDAQTLEEIEDILVTALADVSMPAGYEYAGELFGLFTCTEERTSCDISAPTSGDEDGDGVADADDGCPTVYDPHQWDTDGDGVGDSCDDCPLDAGSSDCEPTVGDTDGDGVGNEDDNCPTLANADQADRDADGVGDACDACPDEPSPDGACSSTVFAVQDADDPAHVAEGANVRLEGLVVTGVASGSGFFAQDPAGGPYSGVYVYDGEGGVARGDVVDVAGTVTEYYDMTEIVLGSLTVTGSAAEPAPVVVDACDIGTGGALSEPYEGVLVQVEGVEVSNLNPDGSSDYDEFEVAGCLRVNDFLDENLDQPAEVVTFASITGPLNYAFSHFKIEPRSADDRVEE